MDARCAESSVHCRRAFTATPPAKRCTSCSAQQPHHHPLPCLAGHPFAQRYDAEEPQGTLAQLPPSSLAPAHVSSGEALPAFRLRAKDAWGNLCAPSAALQYSLQVRALLARNAATRSAAEAPPTMLHNHAI
jgi:hypothetical protein